MKTVHGKRVRATAGTGGGLIQNGYFACEDGWMKATTELIEHAADLIAQADAIVVASGAGMGVDSGLPDFRGTVGFWKAYPALGQAGVSFHDIASPRAFRAHPERAWGFYGHRLSLYRQTAPHAGFDLLKSWSEQTLHGGCVFTSNVDGHFQRAGAALACIEECHGSIHHLQCLDGCGTHIWPADEFAPEVDEVNCLLLNEPPRCPHCGALARPNVLMFGDFEWQEHRQEAQSRALERRADLSGIGIALTGAPCYDGKYLVAIDLDDIESNMGEAAAKELWFSLGQPYCEWSPSGKGLRMLALSAEPLAESRCNAGGGREVYTKSRFVTITGNKRSGRSDRPGKLKDCTEGLRKMVAAWWPAAPAKAAPLPSVGSALTDATTLALIQTPESSPEVERVRDMLAHISADCPYEQWRTVVWSLLSTGWQCAEAIAREWSESAPERFEETAFKRVVSSYQPGHVSLGSLVFLARQHGWSEPVQTLTEQPQPGRLLTVGQLMSIKPEPYRVRSVLPARGVAAIYGASGSGKSFLALDLAMAVCNGAPHWFMHKLRPAPVVYVALEGQAGMVNRVKAWQQVNGHPAKTSGLCWGTSISREASQCSAYKQRSRTWSARVRCWWWTRSIRHHRGLTRTARQRWAPSSAMQTSWRPN